MSWRITANKSGVLIIDLQTKLVPAIHQSALLVKKTVQLLAVARIFQLPVFVTEQVPDKLGRTWHELHEAGPGFTAIPKAEFSAAAVLPNDLPKNLLIAGVETHVCVRQTVYDLREKERVIYLLGDATGSRHPLDHELALQEMRQDKVLITSVEAMAWELCGAATDARFKALLAVLK